MKKRSNSLLNQMILGVISEQVVEGTLLAGLEDIVTLTHPFQCPYPQSHEILLKPSVSTASQRPNLVSRMVVLLNLARRSTTTSLVGMPAKITLKEIVLWDCQMRNHHLLLQGSATSANHEQLQVGVVYMSCPITNRTTRHKAYCPVVWTVQESSDGGLHRAKCADMGEQILTSLSGTCFESRID